MVVAPLADMLPTRGDLEPAVVNGVKKAVLDELDGESGWRVVSVNKNSADVDVLTVVAAKPAPSTSLTLNRGVQDLSLINISEPTITY